MIDRKFIVVDVTHTVVSKRQFQVLQLANEGRCGKDIARRLGIGLESVKEHKERIFRKMGVRNIGQACAVARAAGLL